jgi:hypothetical protein
MFSETTPMVSRKDTSHDGFGSVCPSRVVCQAVGVATGVAAAVCLYRGGTIDVNGLF